MPGLHHRSGVFEILTFTSFHLKQLFWEDERGKGHRPCFSVKNKKSGDKENFDKIDTKLEQNIRIATRWIRKARARYCAGPLQRGETDPADRRRGGRLVEKSHNSCGSQYFWWKRSIMPVLANISRWSATRTTGARTWWRRQDTEQLRLSISSLRQARTWRRATG